MIEAAHKTQVRQIAARFALRHPGREPLELAAAIGVRLEYGNLGDKDGMFDPSRNLVLLSRSSGPERQRFTMAHEVTHALILQDEDFLSELHDAYEGEALEEAIEVLCNVGASEITVPSHLLEAMLSRGRGALMVPKIAQHFGVSRVAAAIALGQKLATSAIVAILRAKGKNPGRVLEVEFATRSEQMKYPLATGTPMPKDHLCQQVLETGLPMSGEDVIPFRSGKHMPAHVDAHPDGGIVYAVFTVEKPSAQPVNLPE